MRILFTDHNGYIGASDQLKHFLNNHSLDEQLPWNNHSGHLPERNEN